MLPGRTLVLAGHALAFVTLLLRVHDSGVGAWAVAALLGCFALPSIAFMGLAGQLADRYDSRTLLVVGLGLQVTAALGLAWPDPLWTTFCLVIVYEAGQASVAPVWSALLPRVVGEDALGRAVAWQQGLGALAGPAGGALGGVLYQTAGPSAAFLVDAGLTASLIVAALLIRTRRRVAAEQTSEDERTRMLDGVRIVRADHLLWPVFTALLVMIVLIEGVNAGEIFLARDVLGATPAMYGLGEVAAGIGWVGGAVLAGRRAGEGARFRAVLGGFAACATTIALAGLAWDFWSYLVLVVAMTAASGVGNAAMGALLMGRTPDAQRGRVQSGLNGLARTATVVALVTGGLGTSLLGPRALFVIAGSAGLLVMGVAWLALVRDLAADAVSVRDTGGGDADHSRR